MGRMSYNSGAFVVVLDDRALAHLRLVVMTKLRRGESFVLTVPDPSAVGTRGIWIGPSVPLIFEFTERGAQGIDRRRVDQMMEAASSVDGLRLGADGEQSALEAAAIR